MPRPGATSHLGGIPFWDGTMRHHFDSTFNRKHIAKMQQVIRTFLLVKSIFFTNRLIARRSRFVFPLHTLSTPEFRPRTLRDIARLYSW